MTQRVRALTAVTMATVLSGPLVPAASAAAAAADTEPPVGSFVVLSATSSDDPGPMVVEVVQDSLEDNRSDPEDIVREVNWGTGVGFEPWRGGDSIEFSYTSVGRYELKVRVTDRAGNSAVERLGTMVVADSFAPRITVNQPVSDRIQRWETVHGYARDVGLAGMDFVRVKAVQERNRGWYAYLGDARGWQRVRAGRAAATRVARAVRVGTAQNDAWAVSLAGLRAGRLLLRCLAQDLDGNRSPAVVVTRELVD